MVMTRLRWKAKRFRTSSIKELDETNPWTWPKVAVLQCKRHFFENRAETGNRWDLQSFHCFNRFSLHPASPSPWRCEGRWSQLARGRWARRRHWSGWTPLPNGFWDVLSVFVDYIAKDMIWSGGDAENASGMDRASFASATYSNDTI